MFEYKGKIVSVLFIILIIFYVIVVYWSSELDCMDVVNKVK